MANADSKLGSVRRAVAGDEELIRGVRLAALSDAPAAFESTLERAQSAILLVLTSPSAAIQK